MSDKEIIAQADPLGQKNFVLNKWLVVLAATGIGITLIGGGLAWAKGWLSVPEKIQSLEEANRELITLPPRIDALEKAQAEMWQKRSEDHDLLLGIAQSLKDLKEDAAETRQDVKDIHAKAVQTK